MSRISFEPYTDVTVTRNASDPRIARVELGQTLLSETLRLVAGKEALVLPPEERASDPWPGPEQQARHGGS